MHRTSRITSVMCAAEPGEVLVTEEVYRQVADQFPRAQSRL